MLPSYRIILPAVIRVFRLSVQSVICNVQDLSSKKYVSVIVSHRLIAVIQSIPIRQSPHDSDPYLVDKCQHKLIAPPRSYKLMG